MPTQDPIIELKKLRFLYGKRTILNEIDLSLPRGSFTTIAGESGSGKSTLLYILGGFLRPTSGEYLFQNRKVYRWWGEWGLGRFRKKNIGFLFQDFRLLPFLTVEQNIRFPSLFSGVRIEKNRLRQNMEKLGILHRAKAYPTAISGGEAQRTALARALLMAPPVLLLDEPTGNLDHETEKSIVAVLKTLQQEGLTLVCVSHSEYIMNKADRVLHLKDASFNGGYPTEKKQRAKKQRSEK